VTRHRHEGRGEEGRAKGEARGKGGEIEGRRKAGN